ncbi:MAG: putative Ig domain-containing protein [Pseudomonadota bacterium]
MTYELTPPANSWPRSAVGTIEFAAGAFQDAAGNTSTASSTAFVVEPFLDQYDRGDVVRAINIGTTDTTPSAGLNPDPLDGNAVDNNRYGGAIASDSVITDAFGNPVAFEADDNAYHTSPKGNGGLNNNVDGQLGDTGSNAGGVDLDGSAYHTYRDSSAASWTSTFDGFENGAYIVELHFAELFHGGPDARVGDFTVNGVVFGDDYDAYVEGGSSADAPSFIRLPVIVTDATPGQSDGTIQVDVSSSAGQAGYSAIVVYDAIDPNLPPTISVGDVEAVEGGDATVTFTRIGDDSEAVTVNFTVAADTADNSDFGAATPSSPVIIPAGQGSVSITIPIADDDEAEVAETFTVTIDSVSNTSSDAVIEDGSATVTISSSDNPLQSAVPDGGKFIDLGFDDASAVNAAADTGFSAVLGPEATSFVAGDALVEDGLLKIQTADGDLSLGPNDASKNDFVTELDLSSDDINEFYVTAVVNNPFDQAFFDSLVELDPDPNLVDGVVPNFAQLGIVIAVDDPATNQNPGNFLKLIYGGNGGNATQVWAQGNNAQQIVGTNQVVVLQTADGTNGAIANAADSPFNYLDVDKVELSLKIDKAAGTYAQFVTFFDADGNILGGVRPTSTDGFATAAPQAIPPTILDAINAGNTVVGITHNDFEQTPMGVAGYDVPSFEVQYDSFHVSSPDLPEGTDSVRGTVVGDFSEDGQNPTDIDLLPGSNVIQSTQQGDDAPGGRDYDYYTIVVPEGQVLSQILVTDYQTETINGSFVGLIEGDTFPAPPTSDADFPGLAAQLLGGAIVDTSGVDILALMAGGTVQGLSTQGFTVPLPAGTYTVWHSQNGPQTTISLDYQLTDALMDAPVEIFVSLVGLPAADEDGDVGTTDLSFGLSLSDNTFSGDLDIAFDTGDQAGQTQTVTFTNGNGFLTIPVDNDDMDDGDDVVAVTLTGATSQDQNVDAQFLIDANFASGSGTVFEDDTPPFPGADIDVGKVVLAINSGPGGAIENDPIFGIDFVADEQFSTPSGTYTDGQGGSDPFDNPALVGSILETERGGAAFDYTLTERADGTPLVAGEQHVLELIMSEIFFLEAEKRVFDVVVNGAGLVNDLDIVAEVGVDNAATAEVEGIYRIRTLATVNANGEIVIDMAASTNNAKLSGLVLYNLPLADGTVTIADAADKVEEGDTGDTVLEFPLTLAGPDATVTVEYTVNGEAMSTLVGFVDGAGILAVPVSNDNEDNGPETIDVILTGVTEAGFGIEDEDNTASATVTEDELPIGTAPGEDLDNDGIANATDEDVDGDGASNAVGGVAGNVEETFIYDADNEGKVLLPGEMDILEFDTDGTPFQNGLTGVLVSPKATTVEYDAAAADVSGGSLNISASNGDHFNNNNTQQNAFVAGYQAKNGLVVETRFVIPTDWDSNLEGDQASADFQSAGVVIGVDQNQLVKFVYGRGPGEFELAQDHGNGGSPTGTATGENTTPEGAVEVIIRVEAFIDDGVAKAKGIYTFLDGNGQPIPSFTDMEVGPITLNDNGSDANAIDSLKEVIEAGSTVGAGVIQTSTNATADNFDVSYQYLKVTSLTNPADIDDDDVDNTDDPFAYDGNNGLDKVLTPGTEFTQDFNFDANDLPTSAFDEEVGFTGILVNPDFTYPGASEEDPYGNRTVEENVSFDGERISITSSDEDANALPNGQGVPNTSRANTLRDGYQSGVDVTNVDRFEVVARGNSAELITTISTGGFEQFGIQFGAGGVDDFIKLVVGDAGSAVRVQLADNNGYVGDEVNSNIVNNNGTPGPVGVDLASVGDIVFRLQVDKSAGANGQVTGVVEFYDIVDGTNLLTFTTETVDLEPDTAIQSALAGNNSLTGGEGGIAYGFFVTDSGGADAPGAITANFDYLTIRALDTISVSIAAPAEAIDEAGDDGVTTLEFPLTASDSYNATFNVLYTVNNGEQESQEVTFVDGQGVLSIDVPADDLVDADDINVLLTGTANDEFAVLDPANLATGTITEDDAAPAVDQGIVGQSAQETVAYSFDVPADAFGDADTADLTLTAFQVVDGNNVALPSWLGFDGTSFTGTPLEADIGASYTIKVIADDGTNPTAETTFTLDVTRFNEAPVVTPPNPAAVMFDENSTEIVADFDATDVDPEDQDPGDVTFILGGDDAAAFEINDAGELSFVDAPNHDDPQDLNGDNVYDITVSATDGIATSTPEAFSVTINDLDEEVQTADDPADLPGEGIGSPDETETVVYTGSEDVGTPETPYVLPTDVENFDATGTGSVNVSGNAEDNMIGVGLGADDTVDLSAGGSDTVAGSAQELDGTSVDEFGIDDAISVEGTEAAEVMSVGPGSAELGIDTDGDGEVNTTVIIENLDGANLTPAAFEATSDGNGNTEITFIGDTFRFQAEDATLNGYVTTPQGGADNLATIRLPNGTGTGTATFDLSGTNVIPGTYTVTIGYFDETDGEGSIGIQVGDLDETFDLNDTSGSSQPNSISFRTKRFVDVVIGEDELVTITGIKDGANSGEEVRIDYIEFTLGEGDVTNNAPESQGAIDDIAINEGESITPIDLNTIIIDPEEDPLTFEVDGADWLSIDENGILSGTPSPIDAGMTFNVIVTGSDAPNSSATEEFTISVNAAPDASTIPNQSLQVSDTFDLDTSLFFTDAEGIEDLTFSVSGTLPTGVVFDEDTGVFSGTADGVGAFIITVTAEDMGGLSDSASFLLTVQGDDNRPTVRIEAEDFELTDLPGNDGFFVQANNRIALNTNGEGEAIYDFADSGIAEGAYDLRVTFWDENDGTSTAQVMVSQDGGATFTLLGDPDGDGNSIVFDQNGGGNALQQENIRSVTIPGLVVGPNTVLKYTGQRDAAEFLRTDFFELVPTGNQLNFAPTVDGSIDDIELGGIEETTVDLTGIFSDPEQDPLTYDVQLVSPVGGDEWLSVSGSTLVGTPTAPGTYEFFVTATDGPGNSGQSAGTSFTVTVPDNNMAPTVSFNSGDQDALEDNAFETIMVLFEDPEGQAITYSLSEDSPAWLSIDEDSGVVTGTPTNADLGTLPVTIIGADPQGASAEVTVSVTVENTNDAPIAVTPVIPGQTVALAEQFTLPLPDGTFADEDPGDELSYSATLANGDPLPGFLQIDADTGELSGFPFAAGDIELTIIATDLAGESVSADFTVTVGSDVSAPDDVTLQAETFTLVDNYEVTPFPGAEEGEVVQLDVIAPGEISTDLSQFAGNSYTVAVRYVDETDGQASAVVKVDGVEVGSWVFDGQAGVQVNEGAATGGFSQPGNYRVVTFTTPFLVTDTSVLTIETQGQAGEFGRIDSIQLLGQVANTPATVLFFNEKEDLLEDADTSEPIKVADIVIGDDGLGTNTLALDLASQEFFEIGGDAQSGFELLLKAGVELDHETAATLSATVTVDDPEIAGAPDNSATVVIPVGNVLEAEDLLTPDGDLDQDMIANNVDPDIDGDGSLNEDDPFIYDADNGTLLGDGEKIDLTFDKTSTDLGLTGFTGFLQGKTATGGEPDAGGGGSFNEDTGAVSASGGQFIVDPVTSGDTGGMNNPQDDAQVGVKNDTFTIEAEVVNPWFGDAPNPDSFDQIGIFAGVDSSNMIKMVFGQTAGVVEVQSQVDGVGAKTGTGNGNIPLPAGAGLDDFATAFMRMEVELTGTQPNTATVTTFITFADENGQPLPGLTKVPFGSLTLTGSFADALADGNTAVGAGFTHVDGGFGSGTNVDFTATLNRFMVTEGISSDDVLPPSLTLDIEPLLTENDDLVITVTPSDDTSLPGDIALDGDELEVIGGGDNLQTPSSFVDNNNGTYTFTYEAPDGGWVEPISVQVLEDTFQDEAGNFNGPSDPQLVSIGLDPLDPSNPNYVNNLLTSLTDADGIATGGSYDNNATGSVVLDVLAGKNNIQVSNFGADSFKLTNTGDKKVAAVFIDFRDSILSDSVVDFDGSGGDTAAKVFAVNTDGIDGTGQTGIFFDSATGLGPSSGAAKADAAAKLADNDPFNDVYYLPGDAPLPNTTGAGITSGGGYKGLLVKFGTDNGGFENGEIVGFSGDMDPNSIAGLPKSVVDSGATNGWDVGGISGAEVAGSKFVVLFDDGTTAEGTLTSDGSGAGTIGRAVQGGATEQVGLSVNNGSGVYGLTEPDIIVTGDPGQVVQVTLTKGFQPVTNDSGSPTQTEALIESRLAISSPDFQVNNFFDVQTISLTIGANGQAIVPPGAFQYSTTLSGESFPGDDVQPILISAVAVDFQGFAIGDVQREALTNQGGAVVDVEPQLPGFFEANGLGGNNPFFKIQIEDVAALNGGIDPNGNWNYVTAPDSEGRQAGFQGNGYYLYGSNTSTGINGVAPAELLEFQIDIPEELVGEVLNFRIRASRDGLAAGDQQNDAWLGLTNADGTGSIEEFLVNTGGNEPEPVSSGLIKVFGGPNNGNWGYATNFDGVPGNPGVDIEFDEPGKYILQIGGRSQGFHIDWIELYVGNAPGEQAANSTFVPTGPQPVSLVDPIEDITIADGETGTFQVPTDTFNDPNGDPIDYSVSISTLSGPGTGVGGVSINEGTGLISGLNGLAIGTYEVIVTAETQDPLSQATDTFVINVVDEVLLETIEISVDAAGDDYEEKGGGTSGDLELGDNGGPQRVGIRFDDIDIPAGATITDAYIEFEALEDGSGAANFSIGIEDSENAGAFASPADLLGRPIDGTEAWTNVEAWVDGQTYRTPNLKDLIEGVIGGDGISDGALAFLIDPTSGGSSRVAVPFGGPGAAPKLVIEFGSTGGGGNTAPVVINDTIIPDVVPLTEGDPAENYNLDNVFDDAEDNDLDYSVSGAGAQFVSISGSTLMVNAPSPLAATEVTVTATDDQGLMAEETFTLSVAEDAPDNTDPVVEDAGVIPASVTLTEGDPSQAFDLNDVFQDAEDGDNLTYSVSGAGAQFVSISNSTLTVNAPAALAATTITVTAFDSALASVSETFTLTVQSDGGGVDPQFVLAFDVLDGNAVEVDNLPDGGTIDLADFQGNIEFTGQFPGNADPGSLTLEIKDSGGNTVASADENGAPFDIPNIDPNVFAEGAYTLEYTVFSAQNGQTGSILATNSFAFNVVDTSGGASDFAIDVGLTEAEDLELSSAYSIESRGNASGGELAKLSGAVGTAGTVTGSFVGDTGVYDVTVEIFNETDGESPFTLIVNGNGVGTFIATGPTSGAGTGVPDSFTFSGVSLSQGDTIAIESEVNSGSNGGTELGRIDAIDIVEAVAVTTASASIMAADDQLDTSAIASMPVVTVMSAGTQKDDPQMIELMSGGFQKSTTEVIEENANGVQSQEETGPAAQAADEPMLAEDFMEALEEENNLMNPGLINLVDF